MKETISKAKKKNLQNGKIYFSNHISNKGLIQKYILKNKLIQLSNNNKTQLIQFKNGQRIRIDIFPNKTYRWPIGTLSISVREMQIKAMRYHITLVRLAISKKTRNDVLVSGQRQGNPKHCW